MPLSGSTIALTGKAFLPAFSLTAALSLLLVIAIIDGQSRLIPDALNLPFILLAAAYGTTKGGALPLSGLLLLGGTLGAQWFLSRGTWMGSGDVLFGSGIGLLLLHWQPALLCLTLAYILGTCWVILLLTFRQLTLGKHIAFGPFLACACVITLLFGQEIIMLNS
jgi:leader peptidase (prepilin peptidase)/N-methyltransferase